MESYLKAVGTENMPQTCKTFQREKISFGPNLDAFVFFKVNQDTDLIIEDIDGK